jgi:hypothetical protein
MILAMAMDAVPQLVIVGFVIVGLIIAATVIVSASRKFSEWSNNNAQPVRRVPAKIVARRTNLTVSTGSHGTNDHHHHASTSTSTDYFATFELENGERHEFELPEREAGLLIEGDDGELTFQGTRYLGFSRRLRDGTFQTTTVAPLPAPDTALTGARCVSCETPLPVDSKTCPACGWTQPV